MSALNIRTTSWTTGSCFAFLVTNSRRVVTFSFFSRGEVSSAPVLILLLFSLTRAFLASADACPWIGFGPEGSLAGGFTRFCRGSVLRFSGCCGWATGRSRCAERAGDDGGAELAARLLIEGGAGGGIAGGKIATPALPGGSKRIPHSRPSSILSAHI